MPPANGWSCTWTPGSTQFPSRFFRQSRSLNANRAGNGWRQRSHPEVSFGGTMAEGSNKTLWIILGSVAGVLLLGCCACGGIGYFIYYKGKSAVETIADKATRIQDMQDVGFALLKFHDDKKQGP